MKGIKVLLMKKIDKMKKIIILIFIIFGACGEVHIDSYELNSEESNLVARISELGDSLSINIANDQMIVRSLLLRKKEGMYFEEKAFDVFGEKKKSSTLLLNNKNDTSFVVVYEFSSFPSIPAGSEDRSVIIRRLTNDLFYTKLTSLSNERYFEAYVYDANYKISAILWKRVDKNYLFVNKGSYSIEIKNFIDTLKRR